MAGFGHSHSQYTTVEERHIFSPTVECCRPQLLPPDPGFGGTQPRDSTDGTIHSSFSSPIPDGFMNLLAAGLTPLGPATGTGHFIFAENRFTEADDILWSHGAHRFVSEFQ